MESCRINSLSLAFGCSRGSASTADHQHQHRNQPTYTWNVTTGTPVATHGVMAISSDTAGRKVPSNKGDPGQPAWPRHQQTGHLRPSIRCQRHRRASQRGAVLQELRAGTREYLILKRAALTMPGHGRRLTITAMVRPMNTSIAP